MTTNNYKRIVTLMALLIIPAMGYSQLWKKIKEKAEKKAIEKTIKSVFKKNDKNNEQVDVDAEQTQDGPLIDTTENSTSVKNDAIVNLGDDVFEFKAPVADFEDIKMQAYQGLPRFGVLNKFGANDKDYFYQLDQSQKKSIRTANEYFFKSYKLFVHLSSFQYNFKSYTDQRLNAENIGGSSQIKVEGVKRIAFLALTKEYLVKYFCNPDAGTCDFQRRSMGNSGKNPFLVGSNSGFDTHWGGAKATLFRQKRSFEDFKKNHLGSLGKWAQQLWENNTNQVYYVHTINLNRIPYSFESEGYWLRNVLGAQYTFGLGSGRNAMVKFIYRPKKPFEKDEESRKNQILFKVSAQKAEEIEGRNLSTLYVVQKMNVKNTPEGLMYHLDSPILELYEDITLKTKFGQVSLSEGKLR